MPKLAKSEQYTLSNGIPVIMQHYEGPVAATYWWIKTGSCDENPKEAGFAHFLEHMLFKDAAAKETGCPSTGRMARMIESLGGDMNAYTSFDQTVYHVTCAAHHWEKIIKTFGAMAKPQHFLRADFEREREVILEELRKNEDSPGRQLFQGLFSANYAKHPYGKPVIGNIKTLKAATVSDLERFYRRQYVTGNMGLVLVGPIGNRGPEFLKLLEHYYGSRILPKKAAVPHVRPEEPMFRKSLTLVKKTFDVKTPTLAIAFRAPELRHPDVPALDMMTGVLSMGELSRLYQRLFYSTSLATDMSGGLYVPHDPGMFYFQAEMDSVEKIERVAEEIFLELDRMKTEGPTDEEVSRVLVSAESERLYSTQTADGVAGRLGFLKFVLGDLEFDRDYLEDLKTVDKKRVQKIARDYIDCRRMSMVLLLPKDAGEFSTASLVEKAERILGSSQPIPKAKAVKTPLIGVRRPEFLIRPSGIRVVYQENPQSHVVSVHASVLGGLRLELACPMESPEKDWGSSYMMALTWTKGVKTKDAHAISTLVEGRAASIEGFSGRNTVGLQWTGLARDWSVLSKLYSEILVEPTFPEDEVDHSRRVAEESVRSIDDHSSQLVSKLFLQTLFEKHPYGKMSTGSLESLRAIHGSKLRAFHRAWIRPERLVLSVVGAVGRPEFEDWLTALEARFAEYAGGSEMTFPKALETEAPLKGPRWVEKVLNREQCHIVVGGLGTCLSSEERSVLRVLQTLLGGQSGRLFVELREKRSLAYAVSPVSFEGIEPGYIGTYIACAPDKRDEALKGIREVLETLAAKGPTAVEMDRAKEFFLGRRAMELQSDSALAAHYGLETVYDLPFLTDQEFLKTIRSVSASDVQKFCRKYLVTPAMVTAVVG